MSEDRTSRQARVLTMLEAAGEQLEQDALLNIGRLAMARYDALDLDDDAYHSADQALLEACNHYAKHIEMRRES